MTRTTTALSLSMAMLAPIAAIAPAAAEARPVLITAQMNGAGNGIYAAVYLTDAQGAYQGTIWLAGGKARYYEHLRDWYRASRGDSAQIDGITGASVSGGRSLSVTVDIADALIDAGYQIRIDTAVENGRDVPGDVVVPLTSAGADQPVQGRGYVRSLQYSM